MRWTLLLLSLLTFPSILQAELPKYAISEPLGLKDAKHTATNGRQSSRVGWSAGQYMVGASDGFKGNQTLGASVWWTDGQRMVRLGYTGYDYTGHFTVSDGVQQSYSKGMNKHGVTIGYSVLNPWGDYNDNGTPWVWNGTSLIELGMDGVGYRDQFNRRSAGVLTRGINDAGDIVGASGRYNGSQPLGVRPWLLRDNIYYPLGLTGGEFTMNGGYEYSIALKLNQAGLILGESQRGGGASSIGWITDGNEYRYVGLVTPDNESTTPFHHSWPVAMNESGHSAGLGLIRESSTANKVQAVWFDDGVATRRVGLTGDEFTGNATGFQQSELTLLTESGHIFGTSSLAQELYGFGVATWMSDGETTRRTGIWNAEHSRNDGWQYSTARAFTESGRSCGYANRFSGSADFGFSAWVDDGQATHIVGRYGPEFTRADGYQSSEATLMNEAGDAVGYSIRFSGSAEAGRTGWFYDSQTGVTTDITSTIASINNSLGHAYISFMRLGEDKSVIGNYQTYPDGGTTAMRGMFVWSPTEGLSTVESHVLVGLENWSDLSYVSFSDGEDLVGGGWTGPNDNSPMAFRLTKLAAADLNFDRVVDGGDLAMITADFGSNSTTGDVNKDGLVDGADFLLWQRQFSSPSSKLFVTVPEPAPVFQLAWCSLPYAAASARRWAMYRNDVMA